MTKKAQKFVIDPEVKEFATKSQGGYIDAVNEHGSYRAAARALERDYATVYRACQVAIAKASISRGYAPDHGLEKPLAPGLRLRGTSELLDGKTGQRKLIWIKGERDKDAAEENVREFVRYLTEDCHGLHRATPGPIYTADDLLSVYPMGDPHFGMYAWAAEAGDDFDLATAERLTCGAIDRLVASGPSSSTALLLNLGDFFHADNAKNQTPESGHALDVDTRHGKVLQVGLRALVYCIKRLLEKHARVVVWCNRGNHDPESSYALALCLWAFFHNEPRVEIDLTPGLYKYMRFGSVLIGSHHGHGAKPGDLPGLMAAQRAQDWGNTEFRYWYCGHIHHKFVDKEHPGAIVETFRTLAARDAWHAGKGYFAGRDMQLIVHHKSFGEIERHRCDVAMLTPPASTTSTDQ